MQVSLSWKQNHISDFPVLVAHFWPAIKLGSCELPQKKRLAKYIFIIINRFFLSLFRVTIHQQRIRLQIQLFAGINYFLYCLQNYIHCAAQKTKISLVSKLSKCSVSIFIFSKLKEIKRKLSKFQFIKWKNRLDITNSLNFTN